MERGASLMVATTTTDPLGYSEIAGGTAIVTGASSGIGAATALLLAGQGLHVILIGRDGDRLEQQAEAIRTSGGAATSVQVDINASDAGQRIAAVTRERGEPVAVLVHCAGIFPSAPFAETPVEELDRAFQVHVRAPYVITQTLLPDFAEHAAVVFIGSNLSSVGLRNTVAYSATKGAVEAMVRTLSLELIEHGVRVTVVSPGTTLTPMTAGMAADPALMAAEAARVPIGRIAEVEEIATAILYLASPMARFVVGSSLVIDGGAHAQ
jgi:NAD(P)-dependent dehydrogenase (short-subunit alcohol dehydrogenase family)